MKIKSLIILIIGAVVIVMSAMTVSAEELNRTNEVPNGDISVEEYNPEDPILIEPSPYIEPLENEESGEEEIIPLIDRDEPVPFDATGEDGSEISLISQLDSKNGKDVKNSNIPVFIIFGVVGLLIILLLVINRKK